MRRKGSNAWKKYYEKLTVFEKDGQVYYCYPCVTDEIKEKHKNDNVILVDMRDYVHLSQAGYKTIQFYYRVYHHTWTYISPKAEKTIGGKSSWEWLTDYIIINKYIFIHKKNIKTK